MTGRGCAQKEMCREGKGDPRKGGYHEMMITVT